MIGKCNESRILSIYSKFDKYMMRKILCFITICLALNACKKDDTLYYGNMTMGNIKGETIVSDQGNVFTIVNTDIDLSKFEYGRVMIGCDVLRETSENHYDINLWGIASVLTKEAIKSSIITVPESEYNVNDPINIREIWYSGGYINMMIEFLAKSDSDTKHLISLIHDDSVTEEGRYTFTLRHNAFGEVPSGTDEDFEPSIGYVSFPIAGIIKEDTAKITLKWKSHKFENGQFSMIESTDLEKEYDWTRSGFQQENLLPKAPNLKLYKKLLAR